MKIVDFGIQDKTYEYRLSPGEELYPVIGSSRYVEGDETNPGEVVVTLTADERHLLRKAKYLWRESQKMLHEKLAAAQAAGG